MMKRAMTTALVGALCVVGCGPGNGGGGSDSPSPTLVQVVISPMQNTLAPNESTNYAAMGYWSDDTISVASVYWSVSDPAKAYIDNGGHLVAFNMGTVTVRATSMDDSSVYCDGTLTITSGGAPPVAITTVSLPGGVVGQTYGAQIQWTGGSGTPIVSVVVGVMPAGLWMDAGTGVISGTPTGYETQTFTVQVAAGTTDTKQLSITVTSGGGGGGGGKGIIVDVDGVAAQQQMDAN